MSSLDKVLGWFSWIWVVLALRACIAVLAPIAAEAQPKSPTDVELKALGETAGEMEVCSAFFMVVARFDMHAINLGGVQQRQVGR
jgi:hypothetical protein